MDQSRFCIPASMKVAELSNRIGRNDPLVANRQGLPILDDGGRLVGIITRGDVLRATENGAKSEATVLEAGSTHLIVAHPDEILHDVVTRMLRHDIGRVPVVSRAKPNQLLGYVGRADLMKARLRQMEDEHVRERGFGP